MLRELTAACLVSGQLSGNISKYVYFLKEKIDHEFILMHSGISNSNLN